MLKQFITSWNANLDELYAQETQELLERRRQIAALDRVVCECQEDARRELQRAGYLL
jgi:hypothetical protein